MYDASPTEHDALPQDTPASDASVSTERWQQHLLPLMTRMVVGLTIFFFAASFLQLLYLHWNVRRSPEPAMDPAYELLSFDSEALLDDRLAAFRHQALTRLEVYATEKRYHQATTLLLSRIWTRYLGFVTGMILALVGATFILGRLQGSPSELSAEVAASKYSLRSASPGIILAGLGVLLMMTTIVVHHQIRVEDTPLYTRGFLTTPRGAMPADSAKEAPPLSKPPLQRPDTAQNAIPRHSSATVP